MENCFGYSIVNVKYKIFISGIYSHPENVGNASIFDTPLVGIKRDDNNQRVTQKYTFIPLSRFLSILISLKK